jgi:hypothetical protein
MGTNALSRKLIHPLWLASLALMVFNDHFLKTADLLPGWLTGKLSDVTGMIVAPLLLALLVRVRSRRGLAWCHVAIGAVFASINLNPTLAGWWESVTALGPQRWHVSVDPTDLLALPVLLVSWRLLTAVATQAAPRPAAKPVTRALFAIAMLFCAANEPTCGPGECGDPMPWTPDAVPGDGANLVGGFFETTYVIGNLTADKLVVRVRKLRSLKFDCKKVAAWPAVVLSRKLFEPAKAWIVEPNRVLPFDDILGSGTGCRVYLVDASGLPARIAIVDSSSATTLQISANASQGGDRMIGIINNSDGELEWQQHGILSPAPLPMDILPQGACKRPHGDTALAWTTPPTSVDVITGLGESPDGCLSVSFAKNKTWFACLPPNSWPYKEGEKVGFFSLSQGHRFKSMDGWRVISDGKLEQLYFGVGSDIVPVADGKLEPAPQPGCGGGHDSCGGFSQPMEVAFKHADLPDAATVIRAGGKAELSGGKRTLHLLFSEERYTVDPACGISDTGPYFQSVYVVRP